MLLLGRDIFRKGGGPKAFAFESWTMKIGFEDSHLNSVFWYSKVFRLHAILHDAAGAVPSQTAKAPGYCYIIGRGPNCCFLVT